MNDMNNLFEVQSNDEPKKNSERRGKNFFSFFSFKKMITPEIIKVVYASVVCISVIVAISIIFTDDNGYSGSGSGTSLSLLFLLFFNIFWRIFCECIILFFKIHESLESIDDKFKNTVEKNN